MELLENFVEHCLLAYLTLDRALAMPAANLAHEPPNETRPYGGHGASIEARIAFRKIVAEGIGFAIHAVAPSLFSTSRKKD